MMKKSKRSQPQSSGGADDRLSELPDSLIFLIFWYVPMIDVVRTSILSKRWRNLWTTAPFLNFEGQMSLPNLVNRSFFRWNGPRILKLRLYCSGNGCARAEELESWVMFARDKGVEELYLHGCRDESNPVPRCLYSCSSSLKELSINAWRLQIDRNVEWNQLKGLTIADGIDEDAVNKILCGSPKLEVFNLSFLNGRSQKFNIRSNSLKKLSICKYLSSRRDLSFGKELRIWAPKLEYLKIEGILWDNLLVENVLSLTRATTRISGLLFVEEVEDEDDCRFRGITLENGFLSFRVGDNFIQLLQLIKQVDSGVVLYYCCPKVLGAMKRRCIGSSFPNVKSLIIRKRFNDYEGFLGLLELFPQLKRLVLQDNEHYCRQTDAGSQLKFKPSNHQSAFLMQLRTVRITWSEGDTIFPFIEFLLKYASKLKKIVFQVKETPSSSSSNNWVLASQKLLIMPRSSQNCKIVIL